MAKPKKKKPQNQKPRPQGSYRKLSTRATGILSAAARSAYPANLKRLYAIEDEGLADAPANVSPDTADVYRSFLYARISELDDRRIPPTSLQYVTRSHKDTLMSTFCTTAPTVIAFALMDDAWDGGDSPTTVLDTITPVEKLMPMKYYNMDNNAQLQRHVHLQYANGFTTALSDMVDWDAIMSSGGLPEWSRDLMEIIRSLATEERVQDLERRRADVIRATVEWALSEIPEAERQADRTLVSLGVTPDLSRSRPVSDTVPPSSPAVPPKLDLDALRSRAGGFRPPPGFPANQPGTPPLMGPMKVELPPDLAQPRGARLSTEYVQEEPRTSLPWMRPIIALSCLCENNKSASLFRYLIRKFRSDEVFYAAYSLMADMNGDPTCLASVLGLVPMSTRFVHTGVISLFEQDGISDEDVVYDVHERRAVPPEAFELNDGDSSDAADLKRDGTSLWEAVSTASGLLNGPRLRIRMQHWPHFKAMGLSDRDCDILSGYLEGVRVSRIHTLIGSLYMPDVPNRKPIAPAVTATQAPEPPAVRPADQETDLTSLQADYERRIADLKTQADRDIDRATTELRRSRKAAGHELATAESRIRELEGDKAELEKQVRTLQAEVARLSENVLDLTLDRPEDDGPDDTDDGSGLPEWPCEIGRDCVIRFYGGHDNFLAEMTRRFPYVEFSPAWKMPNTDGVAGADLILINTWSMKHKMWYSLKKAIDKSRQDYVLCPTKGANACSRAILDAYAAWKDELDETDG